MPEYDNLQAPERAQENTARGRNLTFSYGAGDLDNKPPDKLSPDEEKEFGNVELFDSDVGKAPGEPPPGEDDLNRIKRDREGRISSQQNPWGTQSVTYSQDYPDKPMTIQTNTPGKGSETYTRNENGTYTDSQGRQYSNVAIDQKTGDITFTRADGTKNIQGANGDSREFDEQGRATFSLNYAKRESTAVTYDKTTDETSSVVITDLRTGRSQNVLPGRSPGGPPERPPQPSPDDLR